MTDKLGKARGLADTCYVLMILLAYGARLYIANTIHTVPQLVDTTDGLEADQAKWDLYAEGLDWKGDLGYLVTIPHK